LIRTAQGSRNRKDTLISATPTAQPLFPTRLSTEELKPRTRRRRLVAAAWLCLAFSPCPRAAACIGRRGRATPQDPAVLRSVLAKLKSGEEGSFPHLASYTEERLLSLLPTKRSFSKTCFVFLVGAVCVRARWRPASDPDDDAARAAGPRGGGAGVDSGPGRRDGGQALRDGRAVVPHPRRPRSALL